MHHGVFEQSWQFIQIFVDDFARSVLHELYLLDLGSLCGNPLN